MNMAGLVSIAGLVDPVPVVQRSSGRREYCDMAILVGGTALVLASLTLILLFLIPPWGLGCTASEVKEVCKPIELSFGGTPGKQCKWYHYGLDQDNKPKTSQPCCYHNPLGGLKRKKKKVCDRSLQPETCRGQSKGKGSMPEVKFGTKCTLIIKDSNSLDVGRYEGFMPDKSKQAHYIKDIDYDYLKCEISINKSCHVRWCFILLAVGVAILLTRVRKLPSFFQRICCQAQTRQSAPEINLNQAGAPVLPS